MLVCGDLAGMRGRFFCVRFGAKNVQKLIKMQKNRKKCKKNEKKSQKNLHISKICCNFAPSFKNEGRPNTKKQPKNNCKNEQNLFHKKLRRNRTDHKCNQSQLPY